MRLSLQRCAWIVSACALTAASLCAAPPDYSKEAAVIQEFGQDLTFAADETWRLDQTAVVHVQSDAGVREYGVLTFGYNADNQAVEIGYVHVRKADGTVVATPADNIQDVSSEISRVAPTFSDLREKQIPVKALSSGDVLDYKVTYIQKTPEIPGQFWYSENFLSGGVVLKQTLRIAVPANKYVKVVSPRVKPDVQEANGEKIYLWSTAQLEPTEQDENKKKQSSQSSAVDVQLTTFKGWDELGRWYGALQADRVTVTPAIQAKAAELTKGLTTDRDKERAIYNYVSTQFRYISISLGIGRYQPHAAADVLANEYGDCKDKHTLFASLLKAAGIEAWPALIGAGIKLDPDVPSPAQFNHVITVVPGEKEELWLDTTAEVAPFGLLEQELRDKQALVIPVNGPAILKTTPASAPGRNFETVEAKGTLASDGTLKAHFELTASGDNELVFRSAFHRVAPAQWQQLVQGLVNGFGFAGTVSNVDVSNPANLGKPFQLSYDYVRENYSDWDNRRITPPVFPMMFPFGGATEKPTDPIELGGPAELTFRASIQLPKNFSAEIPDGASFRSDFVEYQSTYSIKDGVLSASRDVVFKVSKIPVSAWDSYQKFIKSVNDDQNQYIQLAASTGPAQPAAGAHNAEAEALVREAFEAVQRHDLNAARNALAHAERLNPKELNLWSAYAAFDYMNGKPQQMIADFQKEIRNHPDNVRVYRALAAMQQHDGKSDDAIHTLQALLKVAPDDVDTVMQLSSVLLAGKHYQETADLVRSALLKAPDNEPLQLAMAQAQLYSGHKAEGLATVQKLAKDCTDGLILNDAAYFLAETQADLGLARQYAEKSVTTIESDSKQVALSNFGNVDLVRVSQLAAAWDTLGWVYYQAGDPRVAERYLEASWRLTQSKTVADHLAKAYERLQDPKAASHLRGLKDTDLSQLRSVPVSDLPKQEGAAEFFLLFSANDTEDVQFISGDERLKSASATLRKSHFNLLFPDNGPEKIIRRGILSCSVYTNPSCNFVFLLPGDTKR